MYGVVLLLLAAYVAPLIRFELWYKLLAQWNTTVCVSCRNFMDLKKRKIMKNKKKDKIITEAIKFIGLMSNDTVSEMDGKKLIKKLKKIKFCNLHIVNDSTSNKFGTIVELNREIDDICRMCKYGKEASETIVPCYACGDTLKLTQYYR